MESNKQQAPGNAQVIPNQNNPGQGTKNRAPWTDGQTEMLVVMMKEYVDASQYRGQNGWTKEIWNFMAARLNEQFTGADFTVKQVKYRAQRLKREYAIVKSILDRSGFGWDPEKKMPKSIDNKWDELSQEQQKWRYKEFPHYDDLRGVYEGKTVQGKQRKRTTDVLEEKYSLPFAPHEETFTGQVLRTCRLNSPSPTLEAPWLGDGDYDRDSDAELLYGAYSEIMGNNASYFASEEKYKLPEAPPIKKIKNSKGSDEGKPEKGKDVALDNLVAVKNEEAETYKM